MELGPHAVGSGPGITWTGLPVTGLLRPPFGPTKTENGPWAPNWTMGLDLMLRIGSVDGSNLGSKWALNPFKITKKMRNTVRIYETRKNN